MTNVNALLRDHVSLTVECLDRIYLNGYIPTLQVPGQLVRFLLDHRGNKIPSPALLRRITKSFVDRVKAFATWRESLFLGDRGFGSTIECSSTLLSLFRNGRTGFSETLSADSGIRDALAYQIVPYCVRAVLRQRLVVPFRSLRRSMARYRHGPIATVR